MRGKSVAEGKDRKCDKSILHVSYLLTVMFSTFPVLGYIKCFSEKMSVNATDMTYPKSPLTFKNVPHEANKIRLHVKYLLNVNSLESI